MDIWVEIYLQAVPLLLQLILRQTTIEPPDLLLLITRGTGKSPPGGYISMYCQGFPTRAGIGTMLAVPRISKKTSVGYRACSDTQASIFGGYAVR